MYRILAVISLAGLALIPPLLPAGAGEVVVRGGFGGAYRVPTTSIKEARFRTIYAQEYDFSCGSAALASLLTFHYGLKRSEKEVFEAMYEIGDQEQIERRGFSLLDMKNYLAEQGLPSDGYRIDLAQLEKAGLPAIALIDTDGYKHFVIVKGLDGDEVLVGDPSRGIRPLPLEEFQDIWNGIAFVLKAKVDDGRESFNQQADWSVRTRAPFGTALTRTSLSTFYAGIYRAGGIF